MTNEERKLKEAEERRKKKNIESKDYDRVIHEDGTLASFGFNDNYRND